MFCLGCPCRALFCLKEPAPLRRNQRVRGEIQDYSKGRHFTYMTTAQSLTRKKRMDLPAALLTGATTVLRPIAAEDLPVLQRWDDDPEISALMGQKYLEVNIRDWFHSLPTDRTCRAWAITNQGGRLIGELELAQLNWRNGTVELRICIGEKDCWNHGYGTDAVRIAVRLAFEGLGLRAVYLRVFVANRRAIHVYRRIGFRAEAMLQPSRRRNDPSPVLLMNLTQERWHRLQAQSAS
ncbi:MAG: putative acetyltransferase [Firmicutes bacterium]|nr:putative acetyltransferase [Bacillota bacterium]